MSEENKGGRPRKIETPEEFDGLVLDYIQTCGTEGIHITWTGLALHLGFASRSSIDEYEKYDGFSYSVKRAKLLVENAYEQKLYGSNVTGPIFALKNMNWKDKTETQFSGNVGLGEALNSGNERVRNAVKPES